jgi:hypothetical protein
MAQMVVTMTRVNGVYERELGITFQFVPNNFNIMYYDPRLIRLMVNITNAGGYRCEYWRCKL